MKFSYLVNDAVDGGSQTMRSFETHSLDPVVNDRLIREVLKNDGIDENELDSVMKAMGFVGDALTMTLEQLEALEIATAEGEAEFERAQANAKLQPIEFAPTFSSFKAQKAQHVYLDQDKKSPKLNGETTYVVFEKYDGWYGYYDFGNPDAGIRSRNNRTIPSLAGFAEVLRVAAERDQHYTGILVFEITLPEFPEFHVMNGILNRKQLFTGKLILQCHDFIMNRPLPFSERDGMRCDIVAGMGLSFLHSAPIIGVARDAEKAYACANEVWQGGGEGVILKDVAALYHQGARNGTLMKIKEECTLDLLVTGMLEGEGKYKGTLGALIVIDSNGRKHTVSGMTDEQRTDWWADYNKIVNRVVEVKCMKVNKDGSLREPRFKAVRHDKIITEID